MSTVDSDCKERILVIAPAWLGDLVIAHSLFQSLKKQRPACTLDVLVPKALMPVLERMPGVDGCLAAPFEHGRLQLGDRYRLGRRLRKNQYHQAIILLNSYKSALVPYWAHIPRRTGWLGEQRYGLVNDIRRINKKNRLSLVEQFISLGAESDLRVSSAIETPRLMPSISGIHQALARLDLKAEPERLLILCPGAAFGAAKQWLPEYYAAVANHQLDRGGQVWIFGAPKDKEVSDFIAALTQNRALSLAGKTDLGAAIDLMSLASLVISNDSGLMHVGAALGRPLIAIYGSSSPLYTPPLSGTAIIARAPVVCSPCFKRVCPLPSPQHMQCMRALRPQWVFDQMEILLHTHGKGQADK